MATATPDTYTVASGATVYAGRVPSQPSWTPAAGHATPIGYTAGAHPLSLPATLYDIRPAVQSWVGSEPWKTSNNYQFSSITGYCGGAFAPSRRRFYRMGGGHASYCVPAHYFHDLPSLSWGWAYVPLPTDGLDLVAGSLDGSVATARAAVASAYTNGQFDGVTDWHWQGSSSSWGALAQPGVIQAEAGHSYFGDVYVPPEAWGNTYGAILKLYPGGGRAPECFVPERHYLDLDDHLIKLTANYRSNPSAAAGGSCYFGGTVQRVFSLTNTSGGSFFSALDMLTPSTKTWSSVSTGNSTIPNLYSGGLMAHLPSGLLIHAVPATSQSPTDATYISANQHIFYVVDAASLKAGSAPSWAQLTVTGASWPVRPTYGSNECGQVAWSYCPRNGKFYAINGNNGTNTLFILNPPVGAVTQSDFKNGTWTVTTESIILIGGIPCGGTGGASGDSIISGGTGTLDPMNRFPWDELSGSFISYDNWYQSRPVSVRPLGV